MAGRLASLGELNIYFRSASYVLFETIPLIAHVPLFHISYYSITIILVSAPSSYFILTVSMRDVSCAGYTPLHGIPSYPFPAVYAKWFLVFFFKRLRSD